MLKGFQMYRDGYVTIVEDDLDLGLLQFEVISGTNTTFVHTVFYDEGYWLCLCPDFKHRWNKNDGAFTCKHIAASFFKLAEHLKQKLEKQAKEQKHLTPEQVEYTKEAIRKYHQDEDGNDIEEKVCLVCGKPGRFWWFGHYCFRHFSSLTRKDYETP